MSIRNRKPFELGRYLGPISTQRIHKLDEIKQQLIELDNGLKMEMVGLRERSGYSVDFYNAITVSPKLPSSFAPEVVSLFKFLWRSHFFNIAPNHMFIRSYF